jgi:serine O-acetyltransferase
MFERLREDIQSVFHRDPAARNAFEVLTCYPGMHAIWIHRLSSALWGMGWKWLARLVSNFGRWLTGIEIHPGASLLTMAWASSSVKPLRSVMTSPYIRA